MKNSLWVKIPLFSWLGSMVFFVILLFVYTIADSPKQQEIISGYYVPVIFFGIISFYLIILGALVEKILLLKKNHLLFSLSISLPPVILMILIATSAVIGANYVFLGGRVKSLFLYSTPIPAVKSNTSSITDLTPTIGPKLTTTPIVVSKLAPTISSDPIVDCNFTYLPDQKMKRSECSNSFECQIGGQWYIYTSRDKCSQDQKNSISRTTGGTYNPPLYPPCTVYYPALGYSQTYSYTSPETCKLWQNSANAGSYTSPPTNLQPTPTYVPPPTYRDNNDPVCQNIRNEWEQVKSQIGPLDFTNQNYSSSAEMMSDYLYWKDIYNSKYSSEMCQGVLS